ncbi:MAG: hypothetical protein ACLP5E_22840 [Streptosporangiaceae bacterium]
MSKLRCPKCAAKAGARHSFCEDCGSALPGRVPVVSKAAGMVHSYSPASGPSVREQYLLNELHAEPDPATRMVIWKMLTKERGA